MLLGKTVEKLKSEKLVIGYELGDKMSQISYCYLNSNEPETLSGSSVRAPPQPVSAPQSFCGPDYRR